MLPHPTSLPTPPPTNRLSILSTQMMIVTVIISRKTFWLADIGRTQIDGNSRVGIHVAVSKTTVSKGHAWLYFLLSHYSRTSGKGGVLRRNTLTYLLTPWCRVLLEKLTGLQLVKKFPAFHGTRRFITALTRVRHLYLSCASPVQSIYPHPTSWRSILILSSHLCLGLPSGLFPSHFPTQTLYTPSPHPCPAHLILLDFITRTILGEKKQTRWKKWKQSHLEYEGWIYLKHCPWLQEYEFTK